MANTDPIFVKNSKTAAVQFANADGTTIKDILQADATNGSRVASIGASTTDSAANDVILYVQRGGSGTQYPIGGKRVPALAGTGANPPAAANVLDGGQLPYLLPDGSLILGPSDKLQASVVAAVTSAKMLTLVAEYGDF